MTPLAAFKQAIFYISGLCSQRTLNKPGAVIQRLSDEARQALPALKSDEIGPDAKLDELQYFVGSDQYYQRKETSKLLTEFDKKILKDPPADRKKY
jgi:hypothetical protein